MFKRFMAALGAVFIFVGQVVLIAPATVFADGNPQMVSDLGVDAATSAQIEQVQISLDGVYVAYHTYDSGGDGEQGIYVHNTQTNHTIKAVGGFINPQRDFLDIPQFKLSGNGNYILFSSTNTGLDSRTGDGGSYLYSMNLTTHDTILASIDDADTPIHVPGNFFVSDDGATVIWHGTGDVIYVRNMQSGTTTTVSLNMSLDAVSGNGRYIFGSDIVCCTHQEHRYDLQTQQNIAAGGEAQNISVSDNGRYLVSGAPGVDNNVSRYDVDTGQTDPVLNYVNHTSSLHELGNVPAAISPDGNVVAVTDWENSSSAGLNSSTFQVFTYNFTTGSSIVSSVNDWGNVADYPASLSQPASALSNDGSKVAFVTSATNLGYDRTATNRAYVANTQGFTGVNADGVVPQVGQVAVSPNPKQVGQTATILASTSDDHSGVVYGEFFLRDNNAIEPAFAKPGTRTGFPGLGHGAGTPMTYANGILTGTVGSDVRPGDYTVYVRAQDAAGNWSSDASTQLTVADYGADTTGPTIQNVQWLENPKPVEDSSLLTVTATDTYPGVKTVELFFADSDPGIGNGFPIQYDNGNFTFLINPSLPEGTYNIGIRAIDWDGNASDVVVTELIVGDAPATDTTPPVVTGTSDRAANAAGWYNAPVTISWSSTDPAPSSGAPTVPTLTTANLEGTHTYISGQSCDPSNNCATGSLGLSIDTVKGSGTYTGSATVVRLLGQKINGTANDATSGVAKVEIVSSNGNKTLSSAAGTITLSCNPAKTSCTWTANPASLNNGRQTLTLKITDVAGNAYTTTKAYTIV